MPRWQRYTAYAMAALVVGAHVALWLRGEMPVEQKLRLTLLNAAGWAIVLLPAYGVARWARLHASSDRRR